MSDRKNDPKSLAMLLSSMLIFGSIGVFRRYIPLPSAFLAFSRGMIGGLMILSFMLATKRGGKTGLTARQMALLACAGAAIGVNWILLFEAYNHTTVAVATLCYYMQPTIVTLLSPLVFHERLTAKKAACAAVAVIGMALVSGVLGGAQSGGAKGVLLGLGAAAFYSAVVILNKKIGGVNACRKTAVEMLSAGLVMLPYLLLTGGFGLGSVSAGALIMLLVVGVVHTGLAYLLYFGSMDGLRVQSIAILSYADPVSALLFSALFLREPLSAPGLLGAALIIGSAVYSEWNGRG